jgi:FkbM family methyltransferase
MTAPAPPPELAPSAVTLDAFLGESLRILQPASGYRAGVDAVLLAASVSIPTGSPITVLDCGAGVGTVGLCVAARCPDVCVTLVEREPALLELARRNIAENTLQDRVTAVQGDVTAPALRADAPALAPESFDHVLANPPFHDDATGTEARDPLKRASHAMHASALDSWVRFAARTTKPGGRVTMIHKADALAALLDALKDRFGALSITPIHPYAGNPAIRVLVSGIKGSRAPLTLHPPIILHDPGGAFTPYVGRILRQGAPLMPQTKD